MLVIDVGAGLKHFGPRLDRLEAGQTKLQEAQKVQGIRVQRAIDGLIDSQIIKSVVERRPEPADYGRTGRLERMIQELRASQRTLKEQGSILIRKARTLEGRLSALEDRRGS